MKPAPECIRCLLTIRLRELEQSGIDDQSKLEAALELVQLVSNMVKSGEELTVIASRAFDLVTKKAPDVAGYYAILKRSTNERVQAFLEDHKKNIEKLQGYARFEYLVKLSAIGNLIDYGVAGHSVLEPSSITPDLVYNYDYCLNNTRELYDLVSRGGRKVLWLFDNSGEALYDILLISEIKRMDNTVWGLVKDEPGFQNDVTTFDAMTIGLSRVLDAIESYGYSGSTIHVEQISSKARQMLMNADLVIAKGMSHYEYLSELDLGKPVVFILIPKCRPVARNVRRDLDCLGKIVVKVKT